MLNKAVFIHIPKTGGTTIYTHLFRMFRNNVGLDKTFQKYRRSGIICYSKAGEKACPRFCRVHGMKKLPDNVRIIMGGHFSVRKWKHLGWPMFSIVRDPVDRIISHYSVWQRSKYKLDWTIREFADFCANQMTFALGEDLSVLSYIGMTEFYDKSVEGIENVLGIKFPKPIGRFNKTPGKVRVSKQDRKYIRAVNYKDMALYEKVKEGFI